MKKVIVIVIVIIVGFMIYNVLFPESGISFRKKPELTEDEIASRQVEGRRMVLLAYQKQQSFHAKHGHYTRKLDSIGVMSRGDFYTMRIMRAKMHHFEIRADGNIDNDETLDVWVITQDGKPHNLVNDTKK